MAGWAVWDNLQMATGSSMGKTVLETIYPVIRNVAVAQGWQNFDDVLLSLFSTQILQAKHSEYPTLEQNDEIHAAITAGEIWASRLIHPEVARFNEPADAINWLLQWRVTRPTNTTPAILNQLRANPAIAALFPDNVQAVPWERVNFTQYVIIIYIMGVEGDHATLVLQALIHYVAGLSKMGNMTASWMRSRQRDIIRESNNDDIVIDKRTALKVWDFYGTSFPPAADQWGQLFRYISDACRARNLIRLATTASQSAAQGCTLITMIQSAMSLCSDFNWARFENGRSPQDRTMNAELEIFREDFAALRENPWIRFGNTPGRAPKMANLGYFAKQLLAKAKGVTSVENYAGLELGNLTITLRPWLDRIVRLYIDSVAAAGEGEDVPALLQAGDHLPVDNLQFEFVLPAIIPRQPAAAIDAQAMQGLLGMRLQVPEVE